MQTQNIIVRAFELSRGSDNLDDIRKTLRQEGYANVDAHLAGASIKTDLKKQFARQGRRAGLARPVDVAG